MTGPVRRRLAAYTVMVELGLLGRLYLPDDELYFLPGFLFIGGAMLLLGWVYSEWDRYCAVRILRRLDREQQDLVLSLIDHHGTRATIRTQLDDQPGEAGALAETFPPHPEVLVVANGVFWVIVAADATLLACAGTFVRTIGSIVAVSVGGAVLAGATYLAHRWNRLLEPVREISPYGFGETYADGRRRFLPWSAARWIRTRRLPRRLEIIAHDGRGRVSLPFDSVRFYGACERIAAFGPFDLTTPEDPPSNGA